MLQHPPLSFIEQNNPNSAFRGFQLQVRYIRKSERSIEARKCDKKSCIFNPYCCLEENVRNESFFIIREDKEKQWVDVMITDPQQYNHGYGPTDRSRFFRLYRDTPKIGIWRTSKYIDWRSYAYLLSDGALNEEVLLTVSPDHKFPVVQLEDSNVDTLTCPVCLETDRVCLVKTLCCNAIICCEGCAAEYGKCTLCKSSLSQYFVPDLFTPRWPSKDSVSLSDTLLVEPLRIVLPWLAESLLKWNKESESSQLNNVPENTNENLKESNTKEPTSKDNTKKKLSGKKRSVSKRTCAESSSANEPIDDDECQRIGREIIDGFVHFKRRYLNSDGNTK